MISYSDAQMEQERRDPKWLIVNGVEPKIHDELWLDIMERDGSMLEGIQSCYLEWKLVSKYRLHNGPGYKDGIAIDELKGCKITQRKEQDKPEPVQWAESDVKHLKWIHDRLTEVYGENKNVDYMIKFRQLIDSVDPVGSLRSKTIEAAISKFGAFASASGHNEVYSEMYDAGFLTLPEGDNND